jgi:flagellin
VSIKIGSNQSSLNAQRRLGESTAALSNAYERLSSGQRINKASDDAAGLAIAEDLNSKSRIYAQGIRNGNDGISLLNIADSAIDALTGIVTRIRELTEQSANGTYSSSQRQALDNEAQALSKEFTRITQTTSFNGLKVFDGSLSQGVRLQLGIGVSESINASIGGNKGTGSFAQQATTYASASDHSIAVSLGDLNVDGLLDMVTAGHSGSAGNINIRLGQGNGSFGANTSYSEGINTSALVLGDINGDGILDVISASQTDYDGYSAVVNVRLGVGNGGFMPLNSYSTGSHELSDLAIGDLNSDGILDVVASGVDTNGGITNVFLGRGDGSLGSLSSYVPSQQRYSPSVVLGDLNGDSVLDLIVGGYEPSGSDYIGQASVRLGNGDGTFSEDNIFYTEGYFTRDIALGDLNGDGILDMVTTGASGSYEDGTEGQTTIRLGRGDGTFNSLVHLDAEEIQSDAIQIVDLNGDGILDLASSGVATDGGKVTVRIGRGNGTFGDATTYSAETGISFALAIGDLNSDGVYDLVSAGQGSGADRTTVRLSNSEEGLGAMLDFSLRTQSDALQSMAIIDRTLTNLSKQRGTIGASQSRVNIAINNLKSTTENFKTAESRIRDADIAAEAATLIRTQILQQAASSVLAQANQAPALALQLLG